MNNLPRFDDVIAIESPITLYRKRRRVCNDRLYTEQTIRELVIGFLASEGVIRYMR